MEQIFPLHKKKHLSKKQRKAQKLVENRPGAGAATGAESGVATGTGVEAVTGA